MGRASRWTALGPASLSQLRKARSFLKKRGQFGMLLSVGTFSSCRPRQPVLRAHFVVAAFSKPAHTGECATTGETRGDGLKRTRRAEAAVRARSLRVGARTTRSLGVAFSSALGESPSEAMPAVGSWLPAA